MVAASLIKLRKTKPEGNHFKVPYGNYLAVIGIIATLWLLSGSQAEEIWDTFIWTGLGLVIFGIHLLFKKLKQ
jgi:L-asparagine transporter-like permease